MGVDLTAFSYPRSKAAKAPSEASRCSVPGADENGAGSTGLALANQAAWRSSRWTGAGSRRRGGRWCCTIGLSAAWLARSSWAIASGTFFSAA